MRLSLKLNKLDFTKVNEKYNSSVMNEKINIIDLEAKKNTATGEEKLRLELKQAEKIANDLDSKCEKYKRLNKEKQIKIKSLKLTIKELTERLANTENTLKKLGLTPSTEELTNKRDEESSMVKL